MKLEQWCPGNGGRLLSHRERDGVRVNLCRAGIAGTANKFARDALMCMDAQMPRAQDAMEWPPLHPGSISFVRPKEIDERKGRPRMARIPPRIRGFGSRRYPDATSCRAGQAQTSLSAPPSGRSPKALRCEGAPYGVSESETSYLCWLPHRYPFRVCCAWAPHKQLCKMISQCCSLVPRYGM